MSAADWTPEPVAVERVRFAVRRRDPRRRRGPAVLLLHGVPQTGRMWQRTAEELARDRTAIAADLKGLGDSEVAGSYRIPVLVAELAALVLHEVDGPVDVVGHDWGGVLAMALAARRPEVVRRLVVLNAPYRRVDLRRAAHIPFFCLPVLPELALRAGGPRMVAGMIRYAWRAPEGPDPEALRADADAYADPARVAAMLSYYRENLRPQPGRRRARAVRRPVAARKLVVWGAADPVLPLPVGEAAARDLGPGTLLLSVPKAGHFVVEEAPDVTVPAVAAFLREPEPRG